MSFSIGQSFKLGWESWKNYLGLATLFYLTYVVITGVPSLLSLGIPDSSPGIAFIFLILRFLISIFALLGWTSVNLKMAKREEVKWADFFSPVDFFPRFIGGSLLYSLVLFLGIFVLLVPLVWLGTNGNVNQINTPHHWGAALFLLAALFLAFYLAISFFFWPYFILDKDLSVMSAFSESRAVTKGYRFRLFFLMIISFFLNFFGLLFFLVGLLFTAPLTALIWTHAYQMLSESRNQP